MIWGTVWFAIKEKENKSLVAWNFGQKQDGTFEILVSKRSHNIPWNLPFP